MTVRLRYYSGTGNTERFVEKTGLNAVPLFHPDKVYIASSDYLLLMPTYSDADGRNAVPAPVEKFLKLECNRHFLKGVIAFGDQSFMNTFCRGGEIIAARYGVPVLRRIELSGTQSDIDALVKMVNEWKS